MVRFCFRINFLKNISQTNVFIELSKTGRIIPRDGARVAVVTDHCSLVSTRILEGQLHLHPISLSYKHLEKRH